MKAVRVTLDGKALERYVPLGPKDCAVLMVREGLVLVDHLRDKLRIRLVRR